MKIMKRKIHYLLPLIIIALVFASCEDENDLFDGTLLVGTWRSGTLHEKYLDNGYGSFWDTADDMGENEGLPFSWSISGSELTHIHLSEMNPGSTLLPRIYTITELTATRLSYRDSFNNVTSFVKVD